MLATNINEKVRKAKAAGYSDAQIQTFLSSKGLPGHAIEAANAELKALATQKTGLAEVGKGVVKGLGSATKFSQDAATSLIPGSSLPILGDAIKSGKSAVQNAIGLTDENLEPENETQALSKVVTEIAVPFGPKGASSLAKLPAKAAGAAREAVDSAATKASSLVQTPIPKPVETVLKETPTDKFDNYVQIAKKATENNKNLTPLEFAGKQAEDALVNIQQQLKATGSRKGELMKVGGITGFRGQGLKTFKQELQSLINSKSLVEGDSKLIRDIKAKLEALGDTPSAGQVDKFVDFVQDRVFTGGRDLTVPVTDGTTAAIRGLVSRLNDELKSQLSPEYSQLNDAYSHLISVRNELNTKLGAEGERGGALMKRVFSPSDANTKELFAEVQKLTGIDLVNEATLARYVMDVLGDARQKSMLEQLRLLEVSPRPGNIVGQVIQHVLDYFNSPDELLKRARQQTSGGSGALLQ